MPFFKTVPEQGELNLKQINADKIAKEDQGGKAKEDSIKAIADKLLKSIEQTEEQLKKFHRGISETGDTFDAAIVEFDEQQKHLKATQNNHDNFLDKILNFLNILIGLKGDVKAMTNEIRSEIEKVTAEKNLAQVEINKLSKQLDDLKEKLKEVLLIAHDSGYEETVENLLQASPKMQQYSPRINRPG